MSDAEKAIISLTFEDFQYYSMLAQSGVNENWFETKEARALWGAMEELYQPPAMEVFRTGLERVLAGRISQPGVARCVEYLEEAISLGVPSSHLPRYLKELTNSFQLRLEREAIQKWQVLAKNEGGSVEIHLSEVEGYISQIRRVATPFEVIGGEQAATERRDWYEARLSGQPGIAKIPYELESLNQATKGGMRMGELTVWTAEPGCGKTALLQREAYYQSVLTEGANHEPKEQYVTLYVTLEMNRAHWIDRVIQQETGISSIDLENGTFKGYEGTVFDQLGKLKDSRLYLIDDPMASLEVIQRAADFVARKEGRLDILYVDYAQLINIPDITEELARIQHISRQLSALAKRHNCHVHSIARNNTAGKIHMGKSLEYDCDNWVELKFEQPKDPDPKLKSWQVIAFFHKQRYFERRPAELKWNRFWVRYTDPDTELLTSYYGTR